MLQALRQPFTPEDLRGGWTEESRRRALRTAEAAVADLRAGSLPEAARHFVRWLDHDGVIEGPLLELAAAAQSSMLQAGRR